VFGRRFAKWSSALLAVFGLSALEGCVGHSSAYVEAEVPVAVETYPQAYYDGHVVYWIGDRWYVRRNGVWFYYRAEPEYLYRYRSGWRGRYYAVPPPRVYPRPYYRYRYREVAPPVRRYAPPARRYAPPARRYAPPAHRSR
jgi:hypothetical protein